VAAHVDLGGDPPDGGRAASAERFVSAIRPASFVAAAWLTSSSLLILLYCSTMPSSCFDAVTICSANDGPGSAAAPAAGASRPVSSTPSRTRTRAERRAWGTSLQTGVRGSPDANADPGGRPGAR